MIAKRPAPRCPSCTSHVWDFPGSCSSNTSSASIDRTPSCAGSRGIFTDPRGASSSRSAPAAQVDLAATSDAEAAEPGADPSQAARAESTAGLSPAAPAKPLARGPSDPSKVPAEPARSPEKPRAALAPKPVAAKPAAAAPKTAKPVEAKPVEAKPVEAKPDAPGSGTPKRGQAPPTPLETP